MIEIADGKAVGDFFMPFKFFYMLMLNLWRGCNVVSSKVRVTTIMI